jgi:hypothetical protein
LPLAARGCPAAAANATDSDTTLLELGPESAIGEGKPMPFVLEAWPGGRWFRDLGNNTGHLWGHVQVIKPPTLLEIYGPMFASFPVMSHVQYRLTPDADSGGTRMTLTHRAYGLMPTEFMKGVDQGWSSGVKRIAEIAHEGDVERSCRGFKLAGEQGRVVLQRRLEEQAGRNAQDVLIGLEGHQQYPEDRKQEEQQHDADKDAADGLLQG